MLNIFKIWIVFMLGQQFGSYWRYYCDYII